MNYKKMSAKIINELETRYNKDFEIVQLTYEISGAGNGVYYRAVCKEEIMKIIMMDYQNYIFNKLMK